MPNSDIKLNFITNNFAIFDNQSLVICDITGKEDRKFHFQLRFIQKNSQKIDLNQLESDLKNYIIKIKVNNSLHFNNENKIKFLIALKKLGLDLKVTEIIHNKSQFKIDNNQSKLITVHDKNLISLFCLDSFANFNFGYEISEDLAKNNAPLCCLSFFSGKQLVKKIYLFPASSQSLTNTISKLKNNSSLNPQNTGIPHVEYLPSKSSHQYNEEIQVRINLQTIISEILTHLEKPKCFRKNGLEKADIFINMAKSITNGEALSNISSKLNEHDTWKLLAQHRDPWGFLSFFKGKTHSLVAWETLRDEISNFASSLHTPTPSK